MIKVIINNLKLAKLNIKRAQLKILNALIRKKNK